MNIKNIKLSIILLAGYFFIFPQTAHAVIPPDFIFNIGSQVTQFFSIVVIFFTAIFGIFFNFFKTASQLAKHRKIFLVSAIMFIICSALLIAYFYAMYKQKAEYQKWLVESQKYSIQQNDNSSFDIASTNQINDKLQITNQEFKNAIDSKINNFIVLDARENIEYENGYFPGSLRIRFADLRDGQWDKLPKDKIVYVICWSGIRGKEAVEFLRTKNVRAFYLENGASGWVEFGGAWIGGIKFLERYTDKKYKIVFNTDEVRKMAKEGVILVDTREPDKFKKWHISGSVNIPIMYTPTSNIEIVFGQVPIKSRVITVCDGYVNCFDAKITGVELEKRGHQFLGRYNKPWEYGK